MWKKISEFPRWVFHMTSKLVNDLKKDNRGLSGVVVAILLILVAVLAVLIIWGFLSGWLAELWEQITGRAGGIS